ncbi:acetyl-CoA carboxylase biotin carboxyl carrier protein [Pseudomonas sp. S09G 359]|jgi:acetyl-CoA carboxylase biotin carboxyl carrier protein|uniref:acetyl-CoA carboxylase biotin carboxyl carrier protein n=1 Tax=Pseudomonas sp. S09G 359 TaxID=2054919 RepID=UPI000C6D96F5|nr:acetyl-CoA carboxylase biotin carboxyl carrier protein [Pseudomonas sp. S09G 359]AUG07002.1 acetyl-CoA carboxylase biotin carboxyl carrier protein [Pseudomonas sp. S09G 359]
MDIEKVKELVKLIEGSGLAEIDFKEGNNRVRLRRDSKPAAHIPAVDAPQIAELQQAPVKPKPVGTVISAPMVGVFYRKASATSAAFVEIGQSVAKGDVLCIVEAMKMMNTVEATCSGVIEAIMVEDGQPVEYDQPMFNIV